MHPAAIDPRFRAEPPTPRDPRRQAESTAHQFEQIFLRSIVSQMRSSASVEGGGGLFGDGPGADTYADWFDNNLAEHLSRNGDVGIADNIMGLLERLQQVPAAAKEPPRYTLPLGRPQPGKVTDVHA